MDSVLWRRLPPPWIVFWTLLLCAIATLILVVRCCCRDDGRTSRGGPDDLQPTVTFTEMRLSEPSQDLPDPRPITRPAYNRARNPGGVGGSGTALPLQPQQVPASANQSAVHAILPPEIVYVRSVQLEFALEGDTLHRSAWVTPVVDGTARFVQSAKAVFKRKDAVNYYVDITFRVATADGQSLAADEWVISDVPLTPVGP